MDAVNRIFGQTFLLSSGCAIPMRRQNATELKQRYFRYITSRKETYGII